MSTMRLNIITEGCGWILERCARELEARLSGVTIDGDRAGAVNYYLPYWKRKQREGVAQIGLFTHGDTRARGFVNDFDAYVCMNLRMADLLLSEGVQDARVHVIAPGHYAPTIGAPSDAPAPVTFGVVGNTYTDGRKGEHLVAQMVAAGYDVEAFGSGWPCASSVYGHDVGLLPTWYTTCVDYLVVTSTDEGGPMPVIDAMYYGCPVIAPTGVGWCDEFPALRYEAGSWASLHALLRSLTELPTWQGWAKGHAALLAQMGRAAA